MYDLVVIGNLSYDRFMTPHFESTNRQISGCSYHASFASSRMGIERMALIGAVSDDYQMRAKNDLFEHGIPEFYLLESSKTCGFEIVCDGRDPPELSIIDVADRISIKSIPDEFLNTKFFALSPVLQEYSMEFIEFLCDTTDAGILLDPQFRYVRNGKLATKYVDPNAANALPCLDIIKPNRNEATLITGEKDPFLAAEMIVESGAKTCVITLGADGCILYNGDEFKVFPVYNIGEECRLDAGNTFFGSMAAGLALGDDIVRAVASGTSAASFRVETPLGKTPEMTREKIQSRAETVAERMIVK